MPRNNKHSTVPKWEIKWEQELFTGCETCVEAAIVDGCVEKIPEVKLKLTRCWRGNSQKSLWRKPLRQHGHPGAFTKMTQIVGVESMEKSIKESVSEKTLEEDLNAFRKGLQLV